VPVGVPTGVAPVPVPVAVPLPVPAPGADADEDEAVPVGAALLFVTVAAAEELLWVTVAAAEELLCVTVRTAVGVVLAALDDAPPAPPPGATPPLTSPDGQSLEPELKFPFCARRQYPGRRAGRRYARRSRCTRRPRRCTRRRSRRPRRRGPPWRSRTRSRSCLPTGSRGRRLVSPGQILDRSTDGGTGLTAHEGRRGVRARGDGEDNESSSTHVVIDRRGGKVVGKVSR
jgi:hypothetical protein